ncbi:hypothetical protein [Arthrobacter sp. UYEF21]|uniref:hypothetical protein n=1 Tax=Arthrobacter sp. UYEF21 TaxID=1756364 RepID=UPI0033910F5D
MAAWTEKGFPGAYIFPLAGVVLIAVAARSQAHHPARPDPGRCPHRRGAVWALGLSSSAAQLQATAASLPPALLEITGVLDFGTTIFTWRS